ncbi:SIMPL domain-containing protein [Treponema sp.]
MLISAVFLALGLVGAGFAVSYGLVAMKAGERVVSVRGLAEREVDANLAVWPVTFSAASDSLDQLRKDLVNKTEAVKAFLLKSGIAAEDISVTPPTVRDTRAEMYGSSEPRAFRYVAQATVLARTSDVDALLNAMARSLELVGEGVAVAKDYESRPQFLFTGLNSVKPDMIAEATRNARTAAEQFAADSGSKVGKIKRANQGLFSIDDADPSLPQRKTVRVVTSVDYFLSD